MRESPSQIHQFGDITVDPVSMRVLRGSEPVAIEPKSLKVLLYLIENRDRLVTKEELLKAVWQDTFVTDNALTRTVAQIRKALGDDAKLGRMIETVPRLGYRFIAESAVKAEPKPPKTIRHWYYAAALLLVVCVALGLRQWLKPPSTWSMMRLASPSQFTTSNGLDLYASFAPDGASLAYSSDESGTFQIYVKPLARGARVVQVTTDERQNVQPAWSPDGRLIAYHSAREDGIWVVAALGGMPRRLSEFGNSPAWSPDGTKLVFQSKPLPSLSGVDQVCGGPVSGIWVVGTEGGSPAQVPIPDSPDICFSADPTWKSDGNIIFARQNRGFTQISSVAPDGSGLRVVEAIKGTALTVRWVPERSSIFYSNFSADGDFTIERLPVDSRGKRTGAPDEVVGHGLGVPRALAISRDGKRIAYTATLPTSHIDSLPLKAAALDPSGPPVALTKENIYRYTVPYISPDGRHMAFTLWRKGSNGDIWVSDIDGGHARLLSSAPNHSICTGWLPDSSGVAYVIYKPGGSELWTASLRDGVERRISPTPLDAMFPTLSPDGRYFTYHTRPASHGVTLRKLDLAAGKESDLVNVKGMNAGFGFWSRDGKEVAFEIHLGEDVDLATVASTGGPYTQWTTGHGKTWPGSWSEDGSAIIAAAQRNGIWNIWAIGRDHSEKKLTGYTSIREFVRYPRLTPSGDRIIYEYNETKGNIYVGDLLESM